VSYLLVAANPGQAFAPVFIAANNTNIESSLNLNCENRGSQIISHELSVSADGITYNVL
jgi:hypothetical protein